eukprot:9750023-Ditylum_brightwellii.AAC.1
MEAWALGVDISYAEHMQGFQGNHIEKQRITYKAEGNDFQLYVADSLWSYYKCDQWIKKRKLWWAFFCLIDGENTNKLQIMLHSNFARHYV